MARSLGSGLPRAIVGRALCTGDLNNDGKVDLLISNIEGQPLLLRNVSRSRAHWCAVRVSGQRIAEGAVVTATGGGGISVSARW